MSSKECINVFLFTFQDFRIELSNSIKMNLNYTKNGWINKWNSGLPEESDGLYASHKRQP